MKRKLRNKKRLSLFKRVSHFVSHHNAPVIALGMVIFAGIILFFATSHDQSNPPVNIQSSVGLEELKIKEVEPQKYAFKTLDGGVIEIGTERHSPPKPYLKLNKWDDEVSLKVNIPFFVKEEPVLNNSKIIYSGSEKNIAINFYSKQPEEIREEINGKTRTFIQNENGGVEFDTILYEKPETNQIIFPIETKGLKFYYQPPLNQENHRPEVVSCTETQCFDKDGKVITQRPENVVGSYAVYHESKKGDYTALGGKNYMTGKAFHIYRPKIKDASGKEIWGELNIKSGKLTITIPQDFLDKAVYPVTIDPTFGYTSPGATGAGFNPDYWMGVLLTTPADLNTVTSISAYVNMHTSGATGNHKGTIHNNDSTTSIITNGVGGVSTQWTSSAGWQTSTFATPPSPTPSTAYWVGIVVGNQSGGGNYDFEISYDNVASTGDYNSGLTYASPGTFGSSWSPGSYRWSIYATYTPRANVYYSVGQNTTSHMTGSPTVTVSGGIATFTVAQTATNMGVGDRVTYGSTLALDASTPAAVTGTATTQTTASFTPPANSVLIVCIMAPTGTFTVTDNLGSHLTYTTIGSGPYGNPSSDARLQAWWAKVTTSQAMRVSVTKSSSGNESLLRVLVITGVDTTGPIGATSGGRGVTTNVSKTYTSTRDNSWGWLLYNDYSGQTPLTVPSGETIDSSYWGAAGDEFAVIKQNSTTPTSGTSVTMSTTTPNSGTQITWQYFEILPSSSTVAYISGKISSTQWTLVTKTGATSPDLTTDTTVNSIAHEYASLSAAIAGASDSNHLSTSDLATNNYILNIPCYNDAGGADQTAVTIFGWTTGANNYINIYTPTNTSTECNQSQRHSGKWDTSKYNIYASPALDRFVVEIEEDYVRLEGLQVEVRGTNQGVGGINAETYYINTASDIRISHNIVRRNAETSSYNSGIWAGSNTSNTNVAKIKIWNNIVYNVIGTESSGIAIGYLSTPIAYVYNNTIYGCPQGLFMDTEGGTPTVIAKNNIAYNNTINYIGTFDLASTNNLSNSGTAPGLNPRSGVTVTFISTTPGSEDLHLSGSDAGAINWGANLSADANLAFSDDIDGQSRPCGSAWDIGADERAATQVYYSVGQNTTDHKTGSPTVTISSGTATFSTGQTAANMGVGDRVTYGGSTTSTGVKVITAVNSSTGWLNATVVRLNTSNDIRATTAQTSFADLVVSGFDFTAVPSGSIITGIEVKVEFSSNNAAGTSTIHCALSYDGTNYTAATADQTVTGTTDSTKTYGGTTNTWGRTWSVSELSTTTFRLKVSGKTNNSSYNNRVDYINANVYYAPTLVAYISGKLSSTQWTLVTQTGGTPADVGTAATVSSIAHEYTSLSAALSGASDANHLGTLDLVTGNYFLNIACYYDGSTADTTTVTVDLWTEGANNYIRVYTPNNTSTECNQSQRHNGKWDDTKYRMVFSSGWLNTNYATKLCRPIKFEGIQFAIDPDANDRIIINVYWDDGGHDYIFDSCIFKSLDTDGTYYAKAFREDAHTGSAVNFKIYNCIFYDFVKITYGFAIETQSGSCVDNFYIYNCTFQNNYTAVYRAGGTFVMKNCLFTGNSADAYGTFAAGTDYNATNRASMGYTVTGSGNVHDRVSQTFTFVNEAGDDFHLSGQDLGAMEAGATLSSDSNLAFYNDIDGQARGFGLYWDIGADEYVNTSPTAVGLISFRARGQAASVLVEWETAQEISNLGFNLYRMAGANGSYTKLNKDLIPGLISSVKGRNYSYTDTGVTRGALYYYMLEDVDLSGKVTTHGPVCVDWDGDGIPDDHEKKAIDDEKDKEDKGGSGPEKGQSPVDWTPSPYGESASWVKVENFRARQEADGVSLEWMTSFEVDNLGFNIYREQDGKYYRITADLVPGSVFNAGAGKELPVGQHYVYFDALSEFTGQESYWLDCVGLDGARASFGPIKPEIGGKPIPERLKARFQSIAKHQASREEKVGKILELRKELKSKETEMQASRAVFSSQTIISQVVPGKPFEPRLPPSEAQWVLAAKPAVKISVKEEGWYRVGQPQLAASGLDPLVDPRYLQLYVDGEEQSMMVTGSNDGKFDPEDAVEFYGKGLDTPYTDTRVYWLVVGARPGRRLDTPITDIRLALDLKMLLSRGLRGRGATLSFPYSVELKERTFYFAALKNGEEESFFGSVVYTEPVDQLINVPHPDPSAPDNAKLEVVLQGGTESSHQVKILFNNQDAGLFAFSGQQRGTIEIEIPHRLILDGENIVRLEAQGGNEDVSLVDYIRLTYWRTYTADEDSLKYTAMGTEWISIAGFSTEEIRVVDITDPAQMFEARVKVTPEGSGYAITVKVPGHGQRKLFAFGENKIKKPAGVVANTVSSWHERSQGADVVIISSRDFLDSVRSLKELQEQQGWSVVVVDVEDLYDEFNFGSKSPWPLREFLSRAYDRWVPALRFVVLVGDASYDSRNYLGFGDFDLVPTKYVDTEYIKTASDDWFVDFDDDGLPNMAVGRLPVDSVAEADTVVSKIIRYEGAAGFMNEVLLVADANDSPYNFEVSSAEVAALLPQGMTVRQILRGQNPAARTELLALLNQGQLVVNYIGHGSTEIWKGNLLTSSDAWDLTNSPYLPFLVSMTCLNGFFQDPSGESMAETFLKAQRGGAVAVWASSGLTFPPEQILMNRRLIQLLFNGPGLTIGEAVALSKQAVINMDVRRTWILFGDPTTKLIK